MGSIKRQGIGSGLFMYIGLLIGFANNILYPRMVGEEVLGFTNWLMELAMLFTLLASFGSNATIIRFFPYFKNKDEQHSGYLSFLFLIRTLGLLLTGLLLYFSKDFILRVYSTAEGQTFVDTHFNLLFIALAMIAYLELLENYLAALLRPRVPTFFRDVFARILAMGFILAYGFGYLSLSTFIVLYVCRFMASIAGMLGFTWYIGELHLRSGWPVFRKPVFKEIASYSFYSVFASLGSKITTKIDILMIPALLSYAAAGVYTVYMFFAQVIIIPHQGLAKIASPLLADAWKREAFEEIQNLYSRLALSNLAVGVLIYVGILINLDHIATILGEGFEAGKMVAVFLGLGQLAHAANGYNGLLLNYSPLFRYDLVFKGATAVLTIVTNYLFINWMGITGAAIATALTIVLINVFIQSFIYRHYRMHPFSTRMLSLLGVGIFCLGVNYLIPVLEWHFLADLILRSGIVTLVYGVGVIGLRITPDIADYFWEYVNKVKTLLKR
jgi:O-antigen/teichoic acid export membrane protein